jgi:putative peptidoglycan lipid II flippase
MSNKNNEHNSRRALAKSAGVIGSAVLASRILGFIRDIIIARLFGVYLYAQAFVIAFKLPNLFRDLVGEGASNAAIVPVLSEYLAKGKKEEFWEAVNALLNVLLVVLAGITIVGIIFSPILVRLIAPGFVDNWDKFMITVRLNRYIFPYILLIGLAAYTMGVLNSLRHFTIPAFAPCLLNISIIVCALVWGEGIKGLASGVLIGGMLQLAVQLPVLYKKGFRFRFVLNVKHPAVKKVGRLMAPRLFSSAIYQLNNFIDSIFGSLAFIVGEGGVAALYFSYRLIQFPLGIFAGSISQAILPALSNHAVHNEREQVRATLMFGLRAVVFVMLPATIGFMVLSGQVVGALFQGGKFDAYAANTTASALFFYSIGLCAYGGTRILQCGFFALQDTKTPTKFAAIGLGLSVVLNSALMFPMKISGLALATSLTSTINFLVMFVLLSRKVGGFPVGEFCSFFYRALSAAAGMGLVCWGVAQLQIFSGSGFWVKVLKLLLPIAAGVVSYGVFCLILKVDEIKHLGKLFRK